MSTRHDRNFRSFDTPAQLDASDVRLDPVADGWAPGTWQDTCKFYARRGRTFTNFWIERGGTEDAVDINNGCENNIFDLFNVASGGDYVLTLKGSSRNNKFSFWTIRQPGRVVDIEIGNWSSNNTGLDSGNVFHYFRRTDGLPVTYCYRLGCKPRFEGTETKHLWWRSIGLTAYWWGKYFWHRVLRRPDR